MWYDHSDGRRTFRHAPRSTRRSGSGLTPSPERLAGWLLRNSRSAARGTRQFTAELSEGRAVTSWRRREWRLMECSDRLVRKACACLWWCATRRSGLASCCTWIRRVGPDPEDRTPDPRGSQQTIARRGLGVPARVRGRRYARSLRRSLPDDFDQLWMLSAHLDDREPVAEMKKASAWDIIGR